MKKNWQAIGISVIVAGALVYPALKLYEYIMKKRAAANDIKPEGDHHMKAFIPAYRGHKPHHRTEHNGHPDHGVAGQ